MRWTHIALLSAAALLLALIALVPHAAEASLDESEPPNQYNDWDSAYVVSEFELGLVLELRREGGGDPDFLKLPFLEEGDLVTVHIEQEVPDNTVEYWISDPNRFPVNYYYYQGNLEEPVFELQFAVLVDGPYYLHTGQGFGATDINITFTRTHPVPGPIPPEPGPVKDSNNQPSEALTLYLNESVNTTIGQVWDPSDFFRADILLEEEADYYLRVDLEAEAGLDIQWELYNATGVTRPSYYYTTDATFYGDSWPVERRLTESGSYFIRIWAREGLGWYDLNVELFHWPDDHNNSIEEAYPVADETRLRADVNLTYDPDDYCSIHLEEDDELWMEVVPSNGPVDLYIFDELGSQRFVSRKPGLMKDIVWGWEPLYSGTWYILVEAVYEWPGWEDPPTVWYTIDIWVNRAPRANGTEWFVDPYEVLEDSVDTNLSLDDLFSDADGDPLAYDLNESVKDDRISVAIMEDGRLRIAPAPNASGFKVVVEVVAKDPRGLEVSRLLSIRVVPVNDPPQVDLDLLEGWIELNEDVPRTGIDLTSAFWDVDDLHKELRFQVTGSGHVDAHMQDGGRLFDLVPNTEDWYGNESFRLTCLDPSGDQVSVWVEARVQPVNDAPRIAIHIPPIEMLEDVPCTVPLDYDRPASVPYVGESYHVFKDPEGDPYAYHFSGNGSLWVSIVETLGSNWVDLVLVGEPEFSGVITDLKLWTVDSHGAKSEEMSLLVTVYEYFDPLELRKLVENVSVREGESVVFEEGVHYSSWDVEEDPLSLVWRWFVDGVQVPDWDLPDPCELNYTPAQTAEGDRTVTVTLEVWREDMMVTVEWAVEVLNVNLPPVIDHIRARDGHSDVYNEGQTIRLEVVASDADGGRLAYRWLLDGAQDVGSASPGLDLEGLDPGEHTITAVVTDGQGGEARSDYGVTVTGDMAGFGAEGLGLWALVAVAVVALLVAVAYVYHVRASRSGGPPGAN